MFFVRIALALGLFSSLALAAPFEDSMAQRTLACTLCHGPQGKSGPDGYYPRLAGKPAGYLLNQLHNFKAGRRQYAPMQHLLAPLDDAYLAEIAQYFSKLDISYPAPAVTAATAALMMRGKTIAQSGDKALQIPACVQCHGIALTGVEPFAPGLVGLPRDYLNAQLGSWQTGQRKAYAPDCMAQISKRLSDADVHAVTTWLSSQSVPNPSHPANTRPSIPDTTPIPCGSTP
jgi:cytochrome c553